MGKIHAPFNFVPTPNSIAFPEGALDAVQDVPYEDGFCGKIHVTITAESPIFIRNGHSKEQQDAFKADFEAVGKDRLGDLREVFDLVNRNPEYCSFSHTPDGRFFIPATTFKGAVREVLGILSRGKMKVDPLSKPAIQREIGAKQDATGLYDLLGKQGDIQAGWIRTEGDHYVIIPADKYYRVSLKVLDDSLRTGGALKRRFAKENFRQKDEYKTADYKYKVLREAGVNVEDILVAFDIDSRNNLRVRNLRIQPDGKGRIVLTGQSSGATDWDGPRNRKSRGKYYDFVFVGRNEKVAYTLTDDEFSQYDSVYGDSTDWRRLKKAVNKEKEYPVFFRPAPGQKILDFGLTLLYKLPYKRTPLQIEQKRAIDYRTRRDMAERIFGFVGDDAKGAAVRGRVQFQHLFCTTSYGYSSPQIITLNNPKLTYYPIYIRQSHDSNGTIVKGRYASYNDGQLAGWKRYVSRRSIPELTHEINTNIDTVIDPLKPAAVFEGDITFHNLREFELGALLSALTFHNTDGCYHQVGQGKPYGFGKIKVAAELVEALPNSEKSQTDLKKALKAFEFEVNVGESGSSWFESDTIKELFALSSRGVEDAKPGTDFSYMKLDVKNKDGNDFVNARKERQTLLTFSELLAAAALKPDTCLTTEDFDRIRAEKARRAQAEAEEARRKLEAEEAEKARRRKEAEEAAEARRKQEAEEARRRHEEEEARRRQEEEEARRRQEEEEERRINDEKKERFERPLNDMIAKQLSFNALANNISKWIEFQSHAHSPEDSAIIESKITEIYSKMKSKDKKSWTRLDKWISTFPFLDPSVVKKLFENLVGK